MEDGRNTHASPTGEPPNEPNGGPGAERYGDAKIGRVLEGRRRERGLSLEEVEQATKIRKRYLMGLEREDYAMLTDAVYARGFLKTYANFLGLDGEALSQQLRNRRKPRRERGINYGSAPRSDFERPLITPGGVAGTEKRRVSTSAVVTVVIALLALAAVIGTLYYVGRGVEITEAENGTAAPPAADDEGGDAPSGEGTPDAKPVNRTAAGEAGDAGSTGEEAAGQSAPPDALLVSVTVRERPSWLQVRADGALAYEETASPGFTQTFEAERRLSITSGDAGAVTVRVNGQEAGTLGESGEVVTENFTLKSAS